MRAARRRRADPTPVRIPYPRATPVLSAEAWQERRAARIARRRHLLGEIRSLSLEDLAIKFRRLPRPQPKKKHGGTR